MRLFTIGDSISQGFMSLAGGRTDLAYSSLIADALGMKVGSKDYPIAEWGEGGMPINLELLARKLQRKTGPDISMLEWPAALLSVNDMIDRIEDHYERGPGRADRPYHGGDGWFANIAMWGATVADAWQVTPELCEAEIAKAEQGWFRDGFNTLPGAQFYRNALTLLNPRRLKKCRPWSALDWLKYHHVKEGVDDVIVWLGSNNALGSLIRFHIAATNGPRSTYDPAHGHLERRRDGWNLWSPAHFKADYVQLLDRIDAILDAPGKSKDAKVYLGTIPAVSIAPLAKGVGPAQGRPDPFGVIGPADGSDATKLAQYYKYYTYIAFDIDDINRVPKLSLEQVHTVDRYIAAYNVIIREALKGRKAGRYHLVDMATALLKAAYKRNAGMPTYAWPEAITSRFPMVDTRFYHATREGALEQGGIFSLDGVHPSAIGQGLIAHEFLKVMDEARGTECCRDLDWDAIYESDDLYMRPLRIMPQIRHLLGGALGDLVVNNARQI